MEANNTEKASLFVAEGKLYQGIHIVCRLTVPRVVRAQDGQGISLAYLLICRHFAIFNSVTGSQNYVGWRSGGDLVQHTPPQPQSRANLDQIACDLVP